MTREEAKQVLENELKANCKICMHPQEVGYCEHTCTYREAMETAISALSAEQSDLISRANAIRWVKTECNPYGKPTLDYDSGLKFIEHLKKMPSELPSAEQVTSKLKNPYDSLLTEDSAECKEQKSKLEHDREWIIGCIKHDGFIKTDRFDKANQIILDALADRPSGEWEYDVDADDSFCTNCHKYAIRDMEMQLESDYCPNCGSRMENTK